MTQVNPAFEASVKEHGNAFYPRFWLPSRLDILCLCETACRATAIGLSKYNLRMLVHFRARRIVSVFVRSSRNHSMNTLRTVFEELARSHCRSPEFTQL